MAKKLPKPDLQSLPACAADFIKQVVKKMRYRKKVRADVAAELIAHFEDELKDCSTDEEKEQKAQLLIAEFGDIKLLAVLLRRAKKRCRPLWHTLVARGFQTACLLILCLIVYIAWFLSGKPVITTNYLEQINRLARPTDDESLNAAPLYHKAGELYEKRWDDVAELKIKSNLTAEQLELIKNDLAILLAIKYKDVTSKHKQRIEKWLAENKDILDLVIAGSKKPYYWKEYGDLENINKMTSISMPELSRFRRLALVLLHWRVWINAEQGSYKDAFDDIKACYRLGWHLKGEKSLFEQLVGIAIKALAVHELRSIISQYKIDSAALAALQRDFEQMIADEDFVIRLDVERLSMYDTIQRSFTEDRFGGHLYFESLGPIVLRGPDREFVNRLIEPLHILFTHPDKQQTIETSDRYYAFWDRIAKKTPGQLHSETIDIEKEAAEIIRGNILLRILPAAMNRVHDLSYRNKIDVEATLVIVAILRYNQDNGDYPENLDQLVASGYLKKLPMDCYSDNKPLVYKKTDDSFLLYSVGLNFTDDGGRVIRNSQGKVVIWDIEGDEVFWPVKD